MNEGQNTLLKLNWHVLGEVSLSRSAGKLPRTSPMDCTHPEMAPYIVRDDRRPACGSPEIFDHEFFDAVSGAPAASSTTAPAQSLS